MVKLLSPEQEKNVIAAIQEAETLTTGEIRIHLQSKLKHTAWEDALEMFDKLNMHQTVQRNGVLIFLATADQKLVIVGDKGIHEKVLNHFWVEVRDLILTHFRDQQYDVGLVAGIRLIGKKLQKYFPVEGEGGNENELSDDISYDL